MSSFMEGPPMIGKRDLKCVVLERARSTSGNWEVYLGQHYHDGALCFIVGGYNLKDGRHVARHYNEKNGCLTVDDAKGQAYDFWRNEFKPKMIERTHHEEDEFRDLITRHMYERPN